MRSTLTAGLIIGLSVLGSLFFACAAPFAAIGALAASKMGRTQGLALVVVSWLANQAVGFAILGYPMSTETFAWGGAIGLAAILGFAAARSAMEFSAGDYTRVAIAFASAFVGYELSLYAAGFLLPTADDAFSIATVMRVFEINALAFAGFLLIQWAMTFDAMPKRVLRPT